MLRAKLLNIYEDYLTNLGQRGLKLALNVNTYKLEDSVAQILLNTDRVIKHIPIPTLDFLKK